MSILTKNLPNGLAVIVEEMDHVESASYDVVVPGGIISDAANSIGATLVLAELLGKGAGELDSRALAEAFDGAGIRHGEGAGTDRYTLGGSMVASKLNKGLELVSSIVLNATLPEEDIPAIQSILLQDLESLKDSPARRAMVELTQRFYPDPFNRSSLGDIKGIQSVDRDLLQAIHSSYFRPARAIVSVAGKVNAGQVVSVIEELFGAWQGAAPELPALGENPPHRYYHIPDDSAQLQIVMAIPSAKVSDPLFYEARIIASILGASMFGRLFVEVREKRGLCYSVYARHGASNHFGTMTAYVGTTPERAQESMDVLLQEFDRLAGTITQEELDRSRTNLKASLIMGEESPGARAASNAMDWWLLGRVRSLEEINQAIDQVSLSSLDLYFEKFPFKPCSILTLGRKALTVSNDFAGGGALLS